MSELALNASYSSCVISMKRSRPLFGSFCRFRVAALISAINHSGMIVLSTCSEVSENREAQSGEVSPESWLPGLFPRLWATAAAVGKTLTVKKYSRAGRLLLG